MAPLKALRVSGRFRVATSDAVVVELGEQVVGAGVDRGGHAVSPETAFTAATVSAITSSVIG